MSADVLTIPHDRRPGALDAVDASRANTRSADYKELLKPGITIFVMMSAAAGYLLGPEGAFDLSILGGLLAGTGLTAGGACAINHVMERVFDRRMRRTENRPVAAGRLTPRAGALYGIVLIVAGLFVLGYFTPVITMLLALMTVIGYLAIYTPLKRRTRHNTLIGAVPGALPALGGYAAAAHTIDLGGWVVFGILFLWQLPHFFALAWMYRHDYARGGFAMLPVLEPDGRSTGIVSVVATLLLLIVGMLPTALGMAGIVFGIGMAAVGTAFAIPAFSFLSEPNDRRARHLLLASIVYVPAFFALVVVDAIL